MMRCPTCGSRLPDPVDVSPAAAATAAGLLREAKRLHVAWTTATKAERRVIEAQSREVSARYAAAMQTVPESRRHLAARLRRDQE